MPDFGNILKKNWDAAVAILGFTSSALLTFRSLIDIPLDFRLILIGGFGSVMVALVVLTLTRSPARGAGFTNERVGESQDTGFAQTAKIAVVLLVCALAVLLLRLTVTYHVIELILRTDADPLTGSIELQASHFPTDVTLTLSTPQPDVRLLDWRFNNCRTSDDPVNPPNVQNETPFGVTIHLYRFKTTQKLCISYYLSNKSARLSVSAVADVPNIEVLRGNRVHAYQKYICSYFGGALCVFSVIFFSYRCSWFRKLGN